MGERGSDAVSDAPLSALGLAGPDGRVYAALVANPQSTAEDLAGLCELTPQQSLRALDRLAQQGMATRAPVDRQRFLPVAPDVAIGTLIGHRESELRHARAEMHRLMDAFREASRYTDPAHSVEVLTGGEAIAQRLEHITGTSQYQIRGFDCPPYIQDPVANIPLQRQRLGRACGSGPSTTGRRWPGRAGWRRTSWPVSPTGRRPGSGRCSR